jgi:hypothetical protein
MSVRPKCWCEILERVPIRWQPDFVRFVETGKATSRFLAFLGEDVEVQRACEMAFRADHLAANLIRLASDCDTDDSSRFSYRVRLETD